MNRMDGLRLRLLRSLDRRDFRTGTELGARLGLTRAAVHKHVQALVAHGVPIHRVPGRGYRLADGVSLLDAGVIIGGLSEEARALLAGIDILPETASTSAVLARPDDARPLHCRVCLAENQTAGRGRRGRSWIAAPYRDLAMSVGIEYPHWPPDLPTLGLVTALAVVEALEGLGIRDLLVKWPNDIMHADEKVCGVLLDVTGEAHGSCRVIVGIGINVATGGAQSRDIDQPWTSLEAITQQPLDRNAITARCLNRLLPAFQRFPDDGFRAYRPLWRRLDALRGRPVSIHTAGGATFQGTAEGVDEAGRLEVTGPDGQVRVFTQGDVSVRVP